MWNAISPNAAAAARRLAALLCLAAMTLSAAVFGQSREAPLPTLQLQSRETLGEGDSIRITVFQNPDLTTETRISERRSEEHTSELQSLTNLVCRLLLEKKKNKLHTTRMFNETH